MYSCALNDWIHSSKPSFEQDASYSSIDYIDRTFNRNPVADDPPELRVASHTHTQHAAHKHLQLVYTSWMLTKNDFVIECTADVVHIRITSTMESSKESSSADWSTWPMWPVMYGQLVVSAWTRVNEWHYQQGARGVWNGFTTWQARPGTGVLRCFPLCRIRDASD